jgi:hypothetical protein
MNSTIHWQAKHPDGLFWTNVPATLVQNLIACGFKVRPPRAARHSQVQVFA